MNCSLRQLISEYVYKHDRTRIVQPFFCVWKCLFPFLLSLDGDTDQQMPTGPRQAQPSLHLPLLTPYRGPGFGPFQVLFSAKQLTKRRNFYCSVWLDIKEIINLEHRKMAFHFKKKKKKINGVYSVLPEKTIYCFSVRMVLAFIKLFVKALDLQRVYFLSAFWIPQEMS